MSDENERLIAILICLGIASVVLPAAIPRLGAAASTWLLEHHILVSASRSVFTVPGLHAGPDARRLLIAALLIAAAAAAVSVARRSRVSR